MKTAVVSVTNDLTGDQRIHRTAAFLEKNGFKVILVGRKLKNSLPYTGPFKYKRFKLLFNKGPLFYAEYNLRLFLMLLCKNPDLYFSNDLDTLSANFLASKFHGNKLIYDSHELFTDVPELNNRPTIKKIWQIIEGFILPKIKEMITVSDSVADVYRNKYRIEVKVLRNLPVRKLSKEKALLNTGGKKVIVYQGALNVDRGIEEMISAMKYLDDYVFLIMGTGDIDHKLKQLAQNENVLEKLIFTGKIPLEKLHSYTLNAQLGISLEKDTNLNYRYSLPNKIFDYIQANVPILVSDLPEMKKVIEKYRIGKIVNSHDPKELADLVLQIINDASGYKSIKSNLELAAGELCWEKEEVILESLI
ncbi:MAG: hypothetical protein A2W91_15675 [Bacteroidetes bacterium GWF2_38_335]|nr:MAG: hypothetical protein A2W91_15675 [Bacteroidetes bacterium GWF2_38_335]OFY81531.1 MAG: hypothetical protein A2281_11535 [Bacteroidetes bacterium RIFOXYA12_FULL_38_20]HBS87702.1 glycosyltransferase [Bacteroidales bacterium]